MPRKPKPAAPRRSNNPHVAARAAISGGAVYAPIPGALRPRRTTTGMSQATLASLFVPITATSHGGRGKETHP